MRNRNLLFRIRWGVNRYDTQRLCGGYSSGLRGVAMRKFTVEFYAKSEYSVRERLQEIDNSISNIVWPWPSNIDSSKTRVKKLSGHIEEEKQYQLSDYEYEKEDPTWKYGSNYVTTGKWKMEVVPDEDYVNFQKSPEL